MSVSSDNRVLLGKTDTVSKASCVVKRPKQGEKLRGADKVARIPIKVIPTDKKAMLKKPDWLRVKIPASPQVSRVKRLLRQHGLHSVCEEASCPNLGECFHGGTATFMIMGDICTRRCPFCDVAHGRPNPLDEKEPAHLATAIADMGLRYVVITSVDRDDLRDGGAGHFAECIKEIRHRTASTQIEILVPDFRGRMDVALDILSETPPDIFNHNLETVPALYKQSRPGADYQWSLTLLQKYKERNPSVTTKSGLMLGLGETNEQIIAEMEDMRAHRVDMITLGQYLQPSRHHLPVKRFVHPDEFAELANVAREMGFTKVASGALVRSSYHADEQAKHDLVM
ncbi:Lipoyl synthase [invertebrate metagenome]|uniref:lipoyl synthase n=1 Tax=invertebrate metagenome TaxID=1711999 RepID=A0A2H9TBA2_9ZZZZ